MLAFGALVDAMGQHPISDWGLDLDNDDDLGRWLIASSLLGGRVSTEIGLGAVAALKQNGLETPGALVDADPSRVSSLLRAAGLPRHDQAAGRTIRLARGLSSAGGCLGSLASDAGDLQELGLRLAGLAPGFGVASVTRFLRPLRETWPAAVELPLHPAARAAAIHLGFIDDSQDEEGEPGALRAALRAAPDSAAFVDMEWALEQLGKRACARDRVDRCPLAGRCPRRSPTADQATDAGSRSAMRSGPVGEEREME